MRDVRIVLRYYTRALAYKSNLIQRLISKISQQPFSPEENTAYWDQMLCNTTWKTYLGNTFSIDARNGLLSTIIKHHAPEKPSVLDVACAGGTLSLVLPEFSKYVGVDVSRYATELAIQNIKKENVYFETSDLRVFNSEQNSLDVIIFSEVLYYQPLETVYSEVERYINFLKPNGIIIISMKDDGKSHAIYSHLAQTYTWVDGVLLQQKLSKPDFKTRINQERPSHVIGAFQNKAKNT